MRIKDGKGKTIETVFLVTAAVLTIALLTYLIWLIRHLVNRADNVFDFSGNASVSAPAFNFAKYEELVGPIETTTVDNATTTSVSSTEE